MSTFSKGNTWQIFGWLYVKPVLWKYLALSAVLIFFLKIPVFSQCPEFSSKNTKISVDQSSGNVSVSLSGEIDLRTVRIMIWDFNERAYYFDSRHEAKITTIPSLNVRISSQNIDVQRLPAGDYSIVVEKEGCKLKQIGLGFSGLPNSGIKIE